MLTLTSPVETWLHRWHAGVKLAGVALGTALILPVQDWRLMAAVLAAITTLHLSLGRDMARHALAMLRPLWPFVLVLAIWHLWLAEPERGAVIGGRMLAAVALANLATMTTRLDDMLAVIERLAQPLALLGLRPRVLALAVAMVIRFTPVLLDKMSQLVQSWRARSARRPDWRIILPVALIALDDADHVAEALRARGGL